MQDTDDLKELIQTFKLWTENLVEDDDITSSIYGETKIMDRFIVMDEVSGLADSCKEFADFLTMAWKYWYNYVYVFHVIIPDREIWKKINSQTNICIFFHPVFFSALSLKYFKVIVCQQLQNMC